MGQIILAPAEEGDTIPHLAHIQQANWETRHDLALTHTVFTGITKQSYPTWNQCEACDLIQYESFFSLSFSVFFLKTFQAILS